MKYLEPLGARIVVEKLEALKVSAGGIILPESAQVPSQEATIIAVGAGKLLDNGTVVPPNVKVGERCLVTKFGGVDFSLNGKDYVVLTEDGIIGMIRDTEQNLEIAV